jgi:hypothetical protein
MVRLLRGGEAKRGDVKEGLVVSKLNQEQPPFAARETARARIDSLEVRYVAEEIEQLPAMRK